VAKTLKFASLITGRETQTKGKEVTREEILKNWTIVEVAAPKKGQFFMGCPNVNPNQDQYTVVECSKTFRRIFCSILKKK